MNMTINRSAFKRMMMTGVCLLALSFVFATPAAMAKSKKYKDWLYSCETNKKGKTACFISQTLTRKNKSKKKSIRVLNIKIGFMPGQKKPMAFLQVPLGISLPPGLKFGIDKGKPYRWPYEFCGSEGCMVLVRLDDALIRAMKRGNSAYVIIAGRDRKGTRLPISLSGFTAAYNALRKP